jgi:hypothetical protein
MTGCNAYLDGLLGGSNLAREAVLKLKPGDEFAVISL